MKGKEKRILYMFTTGLIISSLFKFLFFIRDPFFDDVFVTIIIATVIVFEGNLRIDGWLNKNFPWAIAPQKRIVTQFITSLIYTVFLLYGLMFTIHFLKTGKYELINPKMAQVLIPAIFVTIAIIAMDVGYQFFKAWRQSLIEVEKYKTESANAQLANLKNQLNPHFLFNNLSVLTSLVNKDQDKAVEFINELSKVYRYILDGKNTELVSLQEELAFLGHYIYLLKIRFENSISFDLKIDESANGRYLPPMCLQMMVENAIQHNEASQAKPLNVRIYTEQNHLAIENPIQPRSGKIESSKMGLKNIESRYSFFTTEKIKLENDGTIFKVVLPLILQK